MSELIIGRKDRADIPLYGMQNIAVKIDSGAYSSSIHCTSIQLTQTLEGERLEVVFLDDSNPSYTGQKHIFNVFTKKKVKSSTGDEQERFFVKLPIVLFETEFLTDFSLTKRNGLKNPILLGRKLTNNNFLINTRLTNVSYKLKKKNQKIK
jgi:hypothetical protein